MPKLWHFKIFSISNFWVGRAGLQNIDRITKFLNSMRGRESDLHTKFQPNRTEIVKVIRFPGFLVGRLVELVCMHRLKKKSLALRPIIKIHFHTKNQPG